MSDQFNSAKSTSTVNKPLWAAVAVLGVAVLAMGATLIRIQTRPEEPRLAVLAAAATPPETARVEAVPSPADPAQGTKKPVAENSTKRVGTSSPATAASTTGETVGVNRPKVQTVKPICPNCGTVDSVTPVQRDGTAGGAGVIAGGVLGALVGNQVGSGNGKTLATILGAVGGGVAGNTVEKKMKKETVYQVQVLMEDGSTRTLEQATPPSVGAKVIVEGNTLQAVSRSSPQ
jgi:outer membrane lipoprotein SlyB